MTELSTPREHPSRGLLVVLLGAIVIAVLHLDGDSKEWALASLAQAELEVVPGLNLRLVRTPDVFGLTGTGKTAFLIAGLFILVSGTVWVMVRVLRGNGYLVTLAMGLFFVALWANMIDRATRGEGRLDGSAVDFITVAGLSAINVADICAGIGLLAWIIVVASTRIRRAALRGTVLKSD